MGEALVQTLRGVGGSTTMIEHHRWVMQKWGSNSPFYTPDEITVTHHSLDALGSGYI